MADLRSKKLIDMTSEELFLVLSDPEYVIERAQLQEIVQRYMKWAGKKKYDNHPDLKTIVENDARGLYGTGEQAAE